MFGSFRKVVVASLILLTVLTTGAWQSNSAEKQSTSQVEAPLYPGLTWSSLGSSTQNIRINIKGDSIAVSGERFEAQEQFLASFPLPQDLVNYYSNGELAKSGWVSYDAFDGPDGVHYVFSREDGSYLSVEFLKCQSDTEKTCIAVWKSVPVDLQAAASTITSEPANVTSATTSGFSKISPTNGTTGLNAANVTLKWESYSAAQKYAFCALEGTDCTAGTPAWTSTYNTSFNPVPDLSGNKTYRWQVRALICSTCTTKWVYANSGTNWTFQTQAGRVAILGNAGVAGAVLSYTEGTAKKVTAGSDGSYSISLPYNWSGTITPSKTGYLFSPRSASFTNLTANQTIQNFMAGLARTISGNAGVANVTLSYIDSTFQTATTNSKGDYAIIVPTGWIGTVTPTNNCFTFSPASTNYSGITGDLASQNYTPTIKAGCADVNVAIKGTNQGRYGVPTSLSIQDKYTNLIGGPVKVVSTAGGNIVASQRAIYGNSFNEMMGYPAGGFVTEYWFPWYDQVNMQTWILVGNPSTTQTAYVDIYIGGIKVNATSGGVPYTIPVNGQITPQFPGVVNGPVRVVSVTGSGTPSPINIFASERSIYASSFNEVMGYPFNKFVKEYWFPWYDQVNMGTWVLVGNPSTTQHAYVDIYIGGVKVNDTVGGVPYDISPGGNVTPQFPGIVNGPVRVVSVSGNGTPSPLNIFASERSIYASSFNEVMGTPLNQFTTDYYYTWYQNDSTLGTWLLVGNPSATQHAYVDIYIGGVKRNATVGGAPYDIPPNGKLTPQFNLSAGAVHIVSVTGSGTSSPIDIFTSERSIYASSFNEMMGYPGDQLTSEYWFPWYDNVNMKTDIYIGKP